MVGVEVSVSDLSVATVFEWNARYFHARMKSQFEASNLLAKMLKSTYDFMKEQEVRSSIPVMPVNERMKNYCKFSNLV